MEKAIEQTEEHFRINRDAGNRCLLNAEDF